MCSLMPCRHNWKIKRRKGERDIQLGYGQHINFHIWLHVCDKVKLTDIGNLYTNQVHMVPPLKVPIGRKI